MPPDDHRPADLYETDFYLWTQAQAEALRTRGRGPGRIDWERLAEEVEDMGKSERREAMSRTGVILLHLYKLAWSRRTEPRGGWESTIVTQRQDLLDTLTPTIRHDVEARLDALHVNAANAAERSFKSEEPGAPRDAALRWTLAQILGEADDPIG